MTRQLILSEVNLIAGGFNTTNATNSTSNATGYTPPYNSDTEPLRAGVANIGGYANYYIKEFTGVDVTGDSVFYNKLLGMPVALLGVAPIAGGLVLGAHFVAKMIS